mgnify:CR=1 FL=1
MQVYCLYVFFLFSPGNTAKGNAPTTKEEEINDKMATDLEEVESTTSETTRNFKSISNGFLT